MTAHRHHIDRFNRRTATLTYRIDYSAKGFVARTDTAAQAIAMVEALGQVVMIEEDADNPGHYDAAVMVGLADLQILTITPEA
jgi:hypothetical protein